MGWLERHGKNWWIRDVRDGRQICKVLPDGSTEDEARMSLEQYNIRRDLEKEGYDDQYASLLDSMWGPKKQTGECL